MDQLTSCIRVLLSLVWLWCVIWCAHCLPLLNKLHNPKLRSYLMNWTQQNSISCCRQKPWLSSLMIPCNRGKNLANINENEPKIDLKPWDRINVLHEMFIEITKGLQMHTIKDVTEYILIWSWLVLDLWVSVWHPPHCYTHCDQNNTCQTFVFISTHWHMGGSNPRVQILTGTFWQCTSSCA